MTYVDEYKIQTIGSKWNKGKEKKNQVLTELKSDNGLDIKRLSRFIDEYEDTLTGCCTDCKITVEFIERR